MSIILFGAPGAGKGTQAGLLKNQLSYGHVSTGDILRAEIAKGSDLGNQVKSLMATGQLVSDDIVIEIISSVLSSGASNFVFDGFPRTISQAQGLTDLLKLKGIPQPPVVLIDVSKNTLISRLSGRRICSGCNKVYHLEFSRPHVAGVCDSCGKTLIQRDDDKEAVIEARLLEYERNFAPLREYYTKLNCFKVVNGNLEVDAIFSQIKELLNKQ